MSILNLMVDHSNDDSYNRITECDVECYTAPIGFQMR